MDHHCHLDKNLFHQLHNSTNHSRCYSTSVRSIALGLNYCRHNSSSKFFIWFTGILCIAPSRNQALCSIWNSCIGWCQCNWSNFICKSYHFIQFQKRYIKVNGKAIVSFILNNSFNTYYFATTLLIWWTNSNR